MYWKAHSMNMKKEKKKEIDFSKLYMFCERTVVLLQSEWQRHWCKSKINPETGNAAEDPSRAASAVAHQRMEHEKRKRKEENISQCVYVEIYIILFICRYVDICSFSVLCLRLPVKFSVFELYLCLYLTRYNQLKWFWSFCLFFSSKSHRVFDVTPLSSTVWDGVTVYLQQLRNTNSLIVWKDRVNGAHGIYSSCTN